MLHIQDWGCQDYQKAWQKQKSCLEQRIVDAIPDQLILVEHPAVFTTGRRFKPQHLHPENTLPVFAVERGGDITFHEPGQLVGYPIIKLFEDKRDIHTFLRQIEQVLIATLAEFGIQARPDPSTGVWVGKYKLASIGVAFRRWVSYHGFALNVNNPLEHVKLIQPCGFLPEQITTMAEILGHSVDLAQVKRQLVRHFLLRFQGDNVPDTR